jgi:hypothetical protein
MIGEVMRIQDDNQTTTRGVTIQQVFNCGLEEWKLTRPLPGSRKQILFDYYDNLQELIPIAIRLGELFSTKLNRQRAEDAEARILRGQRRTAGPQSNA